MKNRLPAVVTFVLIAAAIAYFALRPRLAGWRPAAAATPEDVVWRMLDAARAGDASAYLQCFDDALERNLARTRAEMGEAGFSNYLKRLNDQITGVAVSDLALPNAGEAALRVEFVLRGRNEAQQYHFKFSNGSWRIAQVDGAETIQPLVPYGASVNEQ